MADPVQYCAAADGTLVYRISHAPSDLPAVRARDILAAWDSATDAAEAAKRGARRAFHFRMAQGDTVSLAVTDRDARCWAGAVDRMVAIHTSYGLSVFLRLLALVGILGRFPGVIGGRDIRRAVERRPRLLRLAAEARLTDEAGFDEQGFLPLLASLPQPAGPTPDLPTGAQNS